ncbi:type II toxin-antitoxin system VapB family antitoxin, partial [Glaciecola sp. SC05]|uniref:type II toxin-antitoxin system VapB family antitoxin n=1 Tax=Glaciecola sp. SC05 TaxID=1987355 RepID=UPI003527C80B
MRTTVSIDDELFDKAIQLCEPGIEKSEIIREAIRTFVRVQSAKRLAALGAQSPDMQDIPRRGTE